MHLNRLTKTLVAGAVALIGLAPAAVAEARCKPQVDYSGTGTYQMVEFDVFASGIGRVRGTPFDGQVTFMLRTDDGTLPAPGECEPGGANLGIVGRHRNALSAVSIGEICGQYVQEPTSIDLRIDQASEGHRGVDRDPPRHRQLDVDHAVRLVTHRPRPLPCSAAGVAVAPGTQQ
ncbi:MAG: hypothetical protein HZB15_05480 [Actinobacteria bacterium]|nr:hypothetical protein [Actinomycetota bacterium]